MKHRFNLWRDCLYPLLRKVIGKKHDCCDKLKNCAKCMAQVDEVKE